MNIEISNELIERTVQVEVKRIVKDWFNEYRTNTFADFVNDAVMDELRKWNYADIATQAAKEIVNKEMTERVCERISMDIARAFAEKYE